MLDLEAAIEADLGIDSIKRVEILSGFQRLCAAEEQSAMQSVMEKLTAARTLNEIVGHISAAITAPAHIQTPTPIQELAETVPAEKVPRLRGVTAEQTRCDAAPVGQSERLGCVYGHARERFLWR